MNYMSGVKLNTIKFKISTIKLRIFGVFLSYFNKGGGFTWQELLMLSESKDVLHVNYGMVRTKRLSIIMPERLYFVLTIQQKRDATFGERIDSLSIAVRSIKQNTDIFKG